MRIRERQLVYGSIYGVATFIVGWLIAYLFTPQSLLTEVPRWKSTLWVYLSAHFVSISGLQVAGVFNAFSEVDLVSQVPALHSLRAVPFLIVALGGVVTDETVGYSTRFWHLIQNSGSVLIGYLSAGLLAFVASEAQPGVSVLIVGGVVLGSAVLIGSTVTQRFTRGIPVFALTSVGGLLLVGLLVVLGGVVVLSSIWPLIGVSVVGAFSGACLSYIVRNAPT